MDNDVNQHSRTDYRAKRKKTNLILNGLIIIVLLLIIIVAYNIFASGNDEKASSKKETPTTEQKQAVHKEKSGQEKTKEDMPSKEEEANKEESSEEASTSEKVDESQAVVTDGGGSPNVLKTIENPAWKPVGTSQTGDHAPVYDSTSVDWQEMLNAISYATGLDPSTMKVFWLGGDKTAQNASVGTVYTKDKPEIYRVFIKWVEGEGWMPTKVEELAKLEK